MPQYQVTKYDPAFRNARGAYTKDEWIMFSQIGCSFDGIVLTEEEYLRVESAYIDVAARFLAEDASPPLRAVSLENHRACESAPPEGAVISDSTFPGVCRSILREEFWCRLEGGSRFIHFGWDYYMFIGVHTICDDAIALAHALGLFVEERNSPYSADDADI